MLLLIHAIIWKRLRHPDVVERGMTRLEISIHGFDPKINYSQMLEEEFNLVKGVPIFHIQPGAEQWLRLAKHITQCALFANKATQEITIFWYGSTVTKRAAGVTTKLKKEHIDTNPKEWEHAIKWMMLNFGFSGVPIYYVSLDVIKVEEEKKQEEQEQDKPKQKQEEQEQDKPEQKQEEQPQEEQPQPQEEQPQEEQEEPQRKRGRPTRQEEEERRSKLTQEEREKEDEEKEKRRQQREERKKIKAEELAREAERRKKLTREERLKEEEERRQEEERKQREKEERKKQEKKNEKNQKKEKEGFKLYITNFSYCLKKGPTFLTPFNQPTKMYISTNGKKVKEPPCPKDEIFNYPSQILPETKNIQWRFRTEPDQKRIGLKKLPKYTLEHFENPGKKLSTNSTRERNKLILLENEENEKWIKNKNFSIEERRQIKKDIRTKIKTNLKDTETIALYEERKDKVDEVFRCFSNPGEIHNILNENEYIHIFAFKVYPNCTRIAYKVQDDIKVCFANPLIEHMLDGLRDTCFNMLSKEETKYKPEYPVYFMPYASLKAKGEDGNDLKIIDEIDGEEVKNFNDMLDQHYGDWKELRRLEKLKTPMMEEVNEEVVKPTATVKLEPGEYKAYKYLKRTYRGKEQIIVYIKREDEREEPIYGYWLSEELKKINLDKTATPIYIRFGGYRRTPTDSKDRITTILSTQTV